jgi:hypothetical protein
VTLDSRRDLDVATSTEAGRRSGADAAPDLAAVIDSTPLQTTPFAHVYVDKAFSPGYYAQLLDRLPDLERYRELSHRDAMLPSGRSARRKFYLFPEYIMLLPAAQRRVWGPLTRVLRSRRLENAFKHKFREALERRFGRSIEQLSFYPVAMLLRDLAGYRIGIHGDSLGKAITVQFYLPRDDSQVHLGTIFHEGRDGEAATRTKALPFRPASGYAFPVLYHETWHSVSLTSAAERNSLMLTYYVQPAPFGWLFHRLKRLWLFAVYFLRR